MADHAHDTQNIEGTDGKTGLTQVAKVPAGPGGGGTIDALLSIFGKLRDLADDVRYSRHEPFVLAATARAIAEEVRSVARAPATDPAPIAAAREAAGNFDFCPGQSAAFIAESDLVELIERLRKTSARKRPAIAEDLMSAAADRLEAVLREPGFGEVRHG